MSSASSFADLPAYLKRQIDCAFDTAASEEPLESPAHKKRKTDAPASVSPTGDFQVVGKSGTQPGGFIVEDDQSIGGGFVAENSEPTAGGFILEDTQDGVKHSQYSYIPLSRIPTALQLLDIQPDDEEVLSVFRNAASGWTRPQLHFAPDQNIEQAIVSRDDWRAVCAVLLEPHDNGHGAGGDSDGDQGGFLQPDFGDSHDEDEHDDEYRDDAYSSEESIPDDSDEEYIEGASSPRPRAQLKSKSHEPHMPSTSTARKLTARQTEECRRAFALFFPDIHVDSDELDKKKIMINDISRVAAVLKEKITAEEIVEMLEAFSTSADKSVNLRDFERMMVTAKLA